MLKLKVIACDVLNREISYLASQSRHYIDVTFLNQGLHNTPDKLREILQSEIDKVKYPYKYYDGCPGYDYIILAYGLCSNGIAGIKSRDIPLVIPRAHDCITLLLGSKEKYKEIFEKNPGTYWFSIGWIERAWQPSEHKYKVLLEEYKKRYGEENAGFLMETEQKWIKEYKNAAFISWECFGGNNDYYANFTKKSAKFLNWNYIEIKGSSSLLKNMLNGEFKKDEVLIVPPGSAVGPSYDDDIIKNT